MAIVLKQFVKDRFPIVTSATRGLYTLLNRYRSRKAYALARAPFLAAYKFNEVFFDNRGNHPTQHLVRTKKIAKVGEADILILGCRTGQEVGLWLKEQPRSVTATDYFPAPDKWQPLQAAQLNAPLRFLAADARCLPFADNSFDLVTSESLLEHVSGVQPCIDEMYRVVRPGGIVYAIFGPLWNSYGGAHFEGAYEHVLLSRQEFYDYIVARNRPIEQTEARFYLDNAMFSYWKLDQYLEAFQQFEVLHSIVFLAKPAFRHRRNHPAEWQKLTTLVSEKDLMVAGLGLWLRKPTA